MTDFQDRAVTHAHLGARRAIELNEAQVLATNAVAYAILDLANAVRDSSTTTNATVDPLAEDPHDAAALADRIRHDLAEQEARRS